MAVMLFKLVALLLSFLGYFLYIQEKGIHIAFAPVITVSSIGVAMFFAGLLNIMPYMVPVIFLSGLACGGWVVYTTLNKGAPPR